MSEHLEKLQEEYLSEIGWVNSMEQGKCVDAEGNALPWYNYAIINFLKERVKSDFSVMEYGSGSSTIFWADNCKNVCTLELKQEWFELAKKENRDNIDIKLITNQAKFAESIAVFKQKFDMIIVDSYDRFSCIKQALEYLNNEGVIMLDNSERENYRKIFEMMKELKWKWLTFSGIGPFRTSSSSTTIFYRNNNCLGI